jgi:L-lactate dehydrogenase (cytochrome)
MILSIEDLRNLAKRRVPRAIFDYADGGAYQEKTLRANAADLDAISFRPRVMVDVSEVKLATTFVGSAASIPLAIGPTGLAGLFHADGEILGARAAAAFGIPFCLSTMSICSIEDVREATGQPFWFQQYLMRDRGFNQELIERAIAAQCSALMLTLDLQVIAERRRDPRNGLSIPPRITLRNALDVATKPAWPCGCCSGSAAPSAIWPAESAERTASRRWPNGRRLSSTQAPTGATSNGSAPDGPGA